MNVSRAGTSHISHETLKHVLIIKMGAAGDVLMATPMLTALHAAHPGIRVTWMVEDSHAALLSGNPLIARVIPFRSSRWRRHFRKLRWFSWLRETRRLRTSLYRSAEGPVDAVLCCHAEQGLWVSLFWMCR